MRLEELDIVDSRIDERQDVSEELLDIVSTPTNETLSMSGVVPRDGWCQELRCWTDLEPRALSPLPTYGCGDCVT